jgi:hypothetical protein
MAIASLSKFTVPLASDQSASQQGLLMPKLKYRFRVSFENFGISTPRTELTKQVAEAARPNVTYDNQEIWVYNSRINLAGRPKWAAIAVKIRDDVTGSVSKLVGEQMQKQFDFFEQSSAASGSDYKFLMRIEMLDGGNGATGSYSAPNVLETWECYGCYVTSVNYGGLSYSAQDPMTIDISIQPDNCIQTTGGAAQPSTRTSGTLATASGV